MPLILGTNSIKDTGYNVANSLRLNDDDSACLNRSNGSSPSSQRIFTFSAWLKRGTISSNHQSLMTIQDTGDGDPRVRCAFRDNDKLYFDVTGSDGSGVFDVKTTAVFRDISAWYHVVFRIDTTQSTAADRVKMYVNGTQITSFSSTSYGSQNYDLPTNLNEINIGTVDNNSRTNFFDGYLAEVVYCDGQSLDPTSFGEFDEDTPTIWKPIDVSGLTFGTNGFYLDFEDSSNLGNDVNGGTDFTSNNLTATDQSTDTCTNNFATMNPIAAQGGSSVSSSIATFSEGNLVVDAVSSETVIGNIGVDTGKWFWEVKVLTDQDGLTIGGVNQHFHLDAEIGYNSPSSPSGAKVFGYYGGNGNKVTTIGDGSQFSSYGNAIAVNNIVGVALNLDDDEVTFYLNGTAQNSGTAISLTALGSGEQYFPAVGNWSGANVKLSFNFGSPAFSISSGNSDGKGYGNFEYSVPSGYYALNSKNLAEFG